ncbi:MAG TPA: pilin [Candidatus Doudnabacteria bacterium]|nr:pilin [Candidatus Doudnabacteria bacterium]
MKFFIAVGIVLVAVFGSLVGSPAETLVAAGTPTNFLCLSQDGSVVTWPSPNTTPPTDSHTCPSGHSKYTVSNIDSSTVRVCVARRQSTAGSSWLILETDTAGGCASYSAQYTSVNSVTIQNRPGATTQTPPPTTGTGTTSQTPTTQQTPTPTSSGDCPQGFEAKGPICVPANPFSGNAGIAGSGDIGSLATTIISALLYFAGIVAVLFIIIGGFYWMTARGNEQQAINGRKTTVNALIGLIIVVLSYLIVQIVTNFITRGS